MTKHQVRRIARLAFIVACACLVALLIVGLVALIVQTPSKATSHRLSDAFRIAGILGGLATVTSAGLNFLQWRSTRARGSSLIERQLMPEDQLVDRADDMVDLVQKIRSTRVVNCHGQRGVGKSFLLGHLADVVNGHRSPGPGHPRPRKVSAALYFDLSTAAGFDEIPTQVCRAALGRADGSWGDFVAHVTATFARRPVLLILDNVNNAGVWPSLGKAAYQYLARRPQDRLVLGSIEPVMLSNLNVERAPLDELDLDAVGRMVAAHGVTLSSEELTKRYDRYGGLPFHVTWVTALGGGTASSDRKLATDDIIDAELIPELEPDTRRLLAYAALFGLLDRHVSLGDLERCPLTHVEARVERAKRLSLLTAVPATSGRRVKIHDLMRDAALRQLTPEVPEAALLLFDRACEQDRTYDAALYAMFADPHEIGERRFDGVLGEVIPSAVRSKNYALLSNLNRRATQSDRILRFLVSDQSRRDLFCFGRASELAGLGRYRDASDELLSSSIVRARRDPDDAPTELQLELRFMQADLAHLQNRYDEAAQMFDDLGVWASTAEHTTLRARCTWGHAHVLRHQGRALDKALYLFDEAIELAGTADELFAKVYSVTGATGIKVFTDAIPDDEEQLLEAVEAEIAATSAHHGYMFEVWKSQAQVAWARKQESRAFEIVEAAIEKALASNDRLLYNLYFERAEFRRFMGESGIAVDDYVRVLEFGRGNGDRNLISNALLGLVSADASAEAWIYHDSRAAARASALRARQIALEADIHATARAAERITATLDADAAARPRGFRLILF